MTAYLTPNPGRRSSVTFGNGSVQSFAYDAASRLDALSNNLGGSATTHDLAQTFSYNPASQSVSRSNDAYAWASHYNVDRSYTIDGLNRIMNIGSTAFTYDGRGNLTNDGTNAFTYTSENLLKTGPGGATLAYDPLGRLYETVKSGATTRFLYDGADRIGEYDGSNAVQRRYVHGPGIDNPIAWYEGSGIDSTTRRFLMADERGSVVSITDSAGATININSYDEYGIPAPGNVGRFGYTGQTWLSETGMWYYKARMYSPTLGRFMQSDPIGYQDGMNWYNYVGSDPVNFTDPTGLCVLRGPPGKEEPCYDSRGLSDDDFKRLFNLYDSPSDLDEIVVTAWKKGKLAGVNIDFDLPYPIEQLWVERKNGEIVHTPTTSSPYIDSCGNVLGKNVPDPLVEMPDDIKSIIHTHQNWGYAWPAAGDYTSAQSYNVYNINPKSAWVLRKGASRGSAPTTLAGKAPKPPSSGSGKTCK